MVIVSYVRKKKSTFELARVLVDAKANNGLLDRVKVQFPTCKHMSGKFALS
ncbi:hypothetical protein Hdeb2414_s1333g01014201 [Helianthus debilis subsp. tardiflorus]